MIIHVIINPEIVTKSGKSLDDGHSIGSSIGVIRIQFRIAPPVMAPRASNNAGEVRSLFVLDKLCIGIVQ